MTHDRPITQFKRPQWYALSAQLVTEQDWRHWALDANYCSDQPLTKQHIPPMVRRRMSSLSQLAVQTALQLLSEHSSIDYLIFSSQHGELPRTVQLIQAILAGEDASPTYFSQSVHNTAAGLTTIIAKQAIPVTSLAAGDDSFHQAMIEAYAYLADNPESKVILVDFDEPLPEVYQPYRRSDFGGYALGLLLQAGTDFTLSWSASSRDEPQPAQRDQAGLNLPQSMLWLREHLTEQPDWTITSSNKQWHWQRSDYDES